MFLPDNVQARLPASITIYFFSWYIIDIDLSSFTRGVTLFISLFKIIIRIFGTKITDPTSGFQCLTREVVEVFTNDSFPCDYPDTNVIVRLHRMGFIVQEFPVFMKQTPIGRGMHKGAFTIIYYFFTMFLSIFITLISDRDYFRHKR